MRARGHRDHQIFIVLTVLYVLTPLRLLTLGSRGLLSLRLYHPSYVQSCTESFVRPGGDGFPFVRPVTLAGLRVLTHS